MGESRTLESKDFQSTSWWTWVVQLISWSLSFPNCKVEMWKFPTWKWGIKKLHDIYKTNIQMIEINLSLLVITLNVNGFYVSEVRRIVKIRAIESTMVVVRGWAGRGMGSYCFMGVENQFCNTKGVLGMGGGGWLHDTMNVWLHTTKMYT